MSKRWSCFKFLQAAVTLKQHLEVTVKHDALQATRPAFPGKYIAWRTLQLRSFTRRGTFALGQAQVGQTVNIVMCGDSNHAICFLQRASCNLHDRVMVIFSHDSREMSKREADDPWSDQRGSNSLNTRMGVRNSSWVLIPVLMRPLSVALIQLFRRTLAGQIWPQI